MSRPAKLAVVGVAALILSGCLPFLSEEEPEVWGEVEDHRLAELQDDTWLDGAPGHQNHRAYGWSRPSVHREVERDGDDEPWQHAGAEVEQAERAGWVPVYVTCAAPEGLVQVDLVRELKDDTVSTARVVSRPALDGDDAAVEVTAVALHHLDGDWVEAPPAAPPPGFDAGVCLGEPEPGYDPRWSGTPVMFDLDGDSPPAH